MSSNLANKLVYQINIRLSLCACKAWHKHKRLALQWESLNQEKPAYTYFKYTIR